MVMIKDAKLRVLFFAIGFSPIASLSLSAFELIPLHISGPAVVLPAIFLGVLCCIFRKEFRETALQGLFAGVVSVTLYDLTRIPFVILGMWKDFIPKIGMYLLNENHAVTTRLEFFLGYLWRYLGNGGGMGMAFFVMAIFFPKHKSLKLWGVVYGTVIFLCLVGTIYLSPAGQRYLFSPTPFTATLGLIGHWVYGFTLGSLTEYFLYKYKTETKESSAPIIESDLLIAK